jgi:hypothetical protein
MPPELDVLLVAPLDDPPLDDVAPELVDVELAPPLEDDDALPSFVSPLPQATTMQMPMTTKAPLMVRS